MPSNRFVELLRELKEMTVRRKVRWYETADDNAFRIRIGENLIRVETYKESQGTGIMSSLVNSPSIIFAAVLLDNKGKVLDEVDSKGATWIRDLFEVARVSALGIDDIASRMLEDLRAGNIGDVSKESEESEESEDIV